MALPKAIEAMLKSAPYLTKRGIKPNRIDPIIILKDPLFGIKVFY